MPDILKGCKLGNAAWQKVLYEQYYGFAFSICMRYARNNEDALEILNDGFVKVFNSIEQLIETEDSVLLSKLFMGWLKKLMINTAINFKRSAARNSFLNTYEPVREVNGHSHSPLDHLAYEELVKLIQNLSPAYRNTFSLYAIEGLKHEEIAEILGISVGASKSNLLKARKNLRKMLEGLQIKFFEDE